MTDFFSKPVSEITFADIEALVEGEKEEGARFELKEQLSGSNNDPDPWMNGKKLGDIAKKKLAKEIVAFANTYGGVIVVGIKESSDKPPRASQIFSPLIPRVHDLAEVLTDCFHNIIDPPISNLITKGIEKDKLGNGVIFIKVEASLRAPHAVKDKHNLAVYVRQGASSIPMTMRNIQSLFFETRSRAERLKNMREEQSEKFHKFCKKNYDLHPELKPGSLAFRCTIIPTDDLGLQEFVTGVLSNGFRRPGRDLVKNRNNRFFINALVRGWQPLVRGAVISRKFAEEFYITEWKVMFNGLFEVCVIAQSHNEQKHPASWYTAFVAEVIAMFHRLRNKSGIPDIEAILDWEILNYYGAKTWYKPKNFYSSDNSEQDNMEPDEEVRNPDPYSITSSDQYNKLYLEIERDIWNAFKVAEPQKADIDIESYIQKPLSEF